MTAAFVVRENLVGASITVCDAIKRLRYRGIIRAISRDTLQYHLLIEVVEKLPDEIRDLNVGELVVCSIPDEYETVMLDGAAS